MSSEVEGKSRANTIVLIYPFILLLISIALNVFVFGVNPAIVSLPSIGSVTTLTVAAVLLLINHTWLMTTTELTRVSFSMHATPEEWAASNTSPESAPAEGLKELERRHHTHRNTTENSVYFPLLAVTLAFVSPNPWAAEILIVGFAVARLGYTYCYLTRRTGGRGLFMTLSLVALYGMASYLVISLLI